MCLRGSIWYQAGVASFTSAQNPANYPGVFTRVTEYVPWIKQTIRLYEEALRQEKALKKKNGTGDDDDDSTFFSFSLKK